VIFLSSNTTFASLREPVSVGRRFLRTQSSLSSLAPSIPPRSLRFLRGNGERSQEARYKTNEKGGDGVPFGDGRLDDVTTIS
jgi:hypothetical protein